MSLEKRTRRELIAEWREKNLQELDENLRVWKSIRDDPESSDKDRIEAAKSIARQMGALSPDRESAAKGGKAQTFDVPEKPALRPDHASEIDELLRSIK